MKTSLHTARTVLSRMGIVLTKRDGEYRVNFKGGKEATAYYTDDLDDAIATADRMLARHNAADDEFAARSAACAQFNARTR